jgi:hypothetical protein
MSGWRRSADRTRLQRQFPANREFYREFRQNNAGYPSRRNSPLIAGTCQQIPCAHEQGIFLREQGCFWEEAGRCQLTSEFRRAEELPFDTCLYVKVSESAGVAYQFLLVVRIEGPTDKNVR